MDSSAQDRPRTAPPSAASARPAPIVLAFVVVHDVAASWTTYQSCGLALARPVPGLLLHAAGPTDEGFRTIDIWASERAHQDHQRIPGDRWPPGLVVPPVVRTLHVLALADDLDMLPTRPSCS